MYVFKLWATKGAKTICDHSQELGVGQAIYVYVYIYTDMGTKTISILDEAYEALKREKRESESFSDVILKLAYRRGKLADSLGKWKMTDRDAKELEKDLKKAWKNFGRGHKWNV